MLLNYEDHKNLKEIAKMVKSGKITLNNNTGVQKVKSLSEVYKPTKSVSHTVMKKPVKEITKNGQSNSYIWHTVKYC